MASIVIAAGADEASVQGIVMNSPDIEETEKPQVVGIDSEQDILTDAEIAGLKLMREEEKLARDVYMELYDKWNLPIFNNIANSEQTHTDAVKTLLPDFERSHKTNPPHVVFCCHHKFLNESLESGIFQNRLQSKCSKKSHLI
jgi:hypothetical protein